MVQIFPNIMIDVPSLPGLKSLPSLSPSSQLKKLTAEKCSLESLPTDFFHFQLEDVNFDENKGEEWKMWWCWLSLLLQVMITIYMLIYHPSISGLKSLPSPSPSSHLKKLTARECSLESLPSDFFHFQLEEVNFFGNKGEEWRMSQCVNVSMKTI